LKYRFFCLQHFTRHFRWIRLAHQAVAAMDFSHPAALSAWLNLAGEFQNTVAMAGWAEHGFPPR
jgi:hypothetical protein